MKSVKLGQSFVTESQKRFEQQVTQQNNDGKELVPLTAPPLKVGVWNCKWLGHYKKKDHVMFLELMKKADCDIMVVIELITSPLTSPNDGAIDLEKILTEICQQMGIINFSSSNDKSGKSSTKGSAGEYIGVIYNPEKVTLLHFQPISEPLIRNQHFDRVPVIFYWKRCLSGYTNCFGTLGFHLHQEKKGTEKRKNEFSFVYNWLKGKDFHEHTVALGDANIHDAEELKMLQQTFVEWKFIVTEHTDTREKHPYDHICHHATFKGEVSYDLVKCLGIGIEPTRITDQAVSDHNALVCTLKFKYDN